MLEIDQLYRGQDKIKVLSVLRGSKMKFSKSSHKDRDNEWYANQHPFTFWIWESDGQFDIAWHYGNSTGSYIVTTSVEDAQKWCYDFALRETLKQLQVIAPEGGRVEFDYGMPKFVCDGSVPDMGYYCCLQIGHKGKCWTNTKRVDFSREN